MADATKFDWMKWEEKRDWKLENVSLFGGNRLLAVDKATLIMAPLVGNIADEGCLPVFHTTRHGARIKMDEFGTDDLKNITDMVVAYSAVTGSTPMEIPFEAQPVNDSSVLLTGIMLFEEATTDKDVTGAMHARFTVTQLQEQIGVKRAPKVKPSGKAKAAKTIQPPERHIPLQNVTAEGTSIGDSINVEYQPVEGNLNSAAGDESDVAGYLHLRRPRSDYTASWVDHLRDLVATHQRALPDKALYITMKAENASKPYISYAFTCRLMDSRSDDRSHTVLEVHDFETHLDKERMPVVAPTLTYDELEILSSALYLFNQKSTDASHVEAGAVRERIEYYRKNLL